METEKSCPEVNLSKSFIEHATCHLWPPEVESRKHCKDHSAKKNMFALLQCEEIGMTLTESLAMSPAASVSGFYLGHPDSCYFNVGKIADDQLHDLIDAGTARRGKHGR